MNDVTSSKTRLAEKDRQALSEYVPSEYLKTEDVLHAKLPITRTTEKICTPLQPTKTMMSLPVSQAPDAASRRAKHTPRPSK